MCGQLNKKSVLFYAFVFSSDLVTCIYSMNLKLIYRDSSHLFRDSKQIINFTFCSCELSTCSIISAYQFTRKLV